jgi:hypothetical protein
MSEYSVSNFFEQLKIVYGLNIVAFLKEKNFNFNNYLYFGVFLILRLLKLLIFDYQISILNVTLMILQSILLLGVGHIAYNTYQNIKLGKQSAIVISSTLLVIHCIIIYIMNLLFQQNESDE